MHTDDGETAQGEVALVDETSAGADDTTPGTDDASPRADDPSVRADETQEGGEPLAPLSDEEFLRAIAALVFASPEPIAERKLARLVAGEHRSLELARVGQALETLKVRLQATGLSLELRSIAGGWQILTAPDTAEVVKRLFHERRAERISPAALETLAVVAYRQPVTKAEIEAIRGVQVGPILRSLVDRGLVQATGRADLPGHPLQYGTTKSFLDRFGLSSLDDLPRDSELAR